MSNYKNALAAKSATQACGTFVLSATAAENAEEELQNGVTVKVVAIKRKHGCYLLWNFVSRGHKDCNTFVTFWLAVRFASWEERSG